MPTNKPEVVLPEAPPIPAHLFDKDQSIVWAAAWETLSKHIADTLTRPANGNIVMVPREPTPEMLADFWHTATGSEGRGFPLTKRQLSRARKAYAAMLSVAPQQHGQEVVDPANCGHVFGQFVKHKCFRCGWDFKANGNPEDAQQPAEAVAVVKLLNEVERNSLNDLLSNLEHEAGDVEDLPPSIEDDDAYWPYHQWHAITKLLGRDNARGITTPAIDIGKLRGLVSEWRSEARDIRDRGMACNYNSIFARADQLAALIGGGGERANDR